MDKFDINFFDNLPLDRRNWIKVNEVFTSVHYEIESLFNRFEHTTYNEAREHVSSINKFIESGYLFLDRNSESLKNKEYTLINSTIVEGLKNLSMIESFMSTELTKKSMSESKRYIKN